MALLTDYDRQTIQRRITEIFIVINENTIVTLQEIASLVMYAAKGGTLEQVLKRIADASRDLVAARYCALGVPNDEGGLRYFIVSGLDQTAIDRISHPPIGKGLLGAIMNEQESLRLPHMADDPRAVGFPEGHPPMDSLLGVPVKAGDQLYGMLYLTNKLDGSPFTEGDQWLIETMAGYAAIAIADSQLRDQQRRLTLLEERDRIGMELHDGIIQSLYAVGMRLDLARRAESIERNAIDATIHDLNMVIEDIRDFIYQLKTRTGEGTTLRGCVYDMMTRLHIPEALEIEVDCPDTYPPFPPVKFESLCLVVNEGLSNIVRHSGATYARVHMSQQHGWFSILIEDNGRGFDVGAKLQEDGLGLRNMQQRVQLYAGKLTIESTPGEGTHLKIQVPVG